MGGTWTRPRQMGSLTFSEDSRNSMGKRNRKSGGRNQSQPGMREGRCSPVTGGCAPRTAGPTHQCQELPLPQLRASDFLQA